MNPLYIISTVFNPRRFSSRYRLYRDFEAWVHNSHTNVNLVTVEIAFGERPFVLTEASNPFHLQLRTRHELWHKERALNLGLWHLSKIRPDWQYVAWMDTDVKLLRDDWAEETVHLLQHYAVVQMFGEAISLGPNHERSFHCRSICHNFHEYGRVDWAANPGVPDLPAAGAHLACYARQGHPGLAWAFRRDELNDLGGWLDTCINGSGDLHMAACYSGDHTIALSPTASNAYRDTVRRYGELSNVHVRQNMSFMPGTCVHYWHGRSKQRGYNDRWRLLDQFQFNPGTDLVLDVQGLYRWNIHDDRVRALADATRKSLAARNEDGNEP